VSAGLSAAIEVDRAWKKFTRGERLDSLRDFLPSMTRALLSRDARAELRGSEFWALRDVSFHVDPGEALGIIGPNGAGKSTMLRLLTRILRPTFGRISVRGRMGALIEVAAAFHPDLTGRENIFLQGAILGMRSAEVARKLDAIVEFAGVGEFIDTPVKRYSSGMHARLGFSVAAHLDPDVLLIDEVLSVGDMAFQRKCIERMREFKRQGVAIAFVSHNLQAVATLCERAMYLQSEVRSCGPVREVLEAYVGAMSQQRAPGAPGVVEIVAAELLDAHGRPVGIVPPNVRLTLQVTYWAVEAVTDLTLGFVVYRSTDGLVVYDGNLPGDEIGLDGLSAGERVTVEFVFRAHLTRGQYHLECHVLHNPTARFLARLRPAGVLTIDESRTYTGVADLEVSGTVVKRVPG
jgi:ABC-type polysaccharide/polyol phosphate transport system ATPase subunit